MQPVTPQTAWAPPPPPAVEPTLMDAADRALTTEVNDLRRKLAESIRLQDFHRSCTIEQEVIEAKVREQIAELRARIPTEHGGTWRR